MFSAQVYHNTFLNTIDLLYLIYIERRRLLSSPTRGGRRNPAVQSLRFTQIDQKHRLHQTRKVDILDKHEQDGGMGLLGVREAARRLDVHENTLRRWEKAGLIRAVRLPTGVRRFREEDVERLHAEMHRAVADPEAT
jgi:excisionase family DNA binding protein